jgi:peptide/nickel transport system substrate-binding protein
LTSTNTRELAEAEKEWKGFYANVARKQLSRRKVLTGSAILAAGSLGAALIGCSDDEESSDGGSSSSGGDTPFEGVTGDWDTTGTAPFKGGIPDSQITVNEGWKRYPWVYKYGPWRYNWDVPVTRGGHIITSFGPASNYNVMISGIASQPVYSKMFNAGLREGLDLLTASIESDLAISSEHNADFTEWTFKIPDNALFHDKPPVNGRKLLAEDVVFSFDRHRDTHIAKSVLRGVDKITAVDDVTVQFDLKSPNLSFEGTLASPNMVVFSPEAFEDQDTFIAAPVGTGPFVLDFSEYQNKADFVRHEGYWQLPPVNQDKYGTKPLPFADKYTRQSFANNVTAKEAFANGEVDYMTPGCGLDTTLIREQLERTPDARVISNGYWSCCPLGIYFNYKNPLFQDIRVRQALSMSINREQVWSGGMDSSGVISGAPIPFDFQGLDVPPPLSDYGKNVQYDPEGARKLLEEAGHTLPLKLKVYQRPNRPAAWQGALDTVVFNWREAGVVDAEVVVRDSLVFSEDQRNGSWPDMLFTITGLGLGYTIDSLVSGSLLTGSSSNYGSLSDPELDALLEKWASSVDPDASIQTAKDISDRIVENVDHLWLGMIGGFDVSQPWLHGHTISTHNCVDGIGLGNMKYVWIGEDAPSGRGGTVI